MTRLFIILLCSSLYSWAHAEGLYLQMLNNTQPSSEQIQKSLKKVEEHKDIALREDLEVPPFHKRNKQISSLGHSFCTTCHLSPPHTKSVRSRTFMNMHTQYIACETCHFRPEAVQLSYQWQDTRDGSLVQARPELFRVQKPVKKTTQSIQPDTMKPEPLPWQEAKAKKINPFYKVTPFYQQQAVVLGRNNAFAQETKKLWESGGIKEKAARRALIHAPLSEKGPKCQACHNTEKSLLDLATLGATAYQMDKIQNNIISQFFARYKDEKQQTRIMSLLR